jgi:adenylate cyclase class 2
VAIEIEKKYRLTKKQREHVLRQLLGVGAELKSEDFEENTLYAGKGINTRNSALRLRRVAGRAILTFKKRARSTSAIKHQLEEETEVSDPEATDGLLKALGFHPALVYEKRRMTWTLDEAEIVVDELPFGCFMEIEADAKEIERVESLLEMEKVQAENATYPQLTAKHGKRRGKMVEARFPKKRLSDML